MQPYQLMFGHKTQTPCDNWLVLNHYDSNESVSRSSWIQEHHNVMQAANRHALKNMQKVQNRVLLKQGEKNCPSWKVVWSYCRITPKTIIKYKTILKTKNLLWWKNSTNLMCTKLNQSMALVPSRL